MSVIQPDEEGMVPVAVHPHGSALRALAGPSFTGIASAVEWDDATIKGGDCNISPNVYFFYLDPEGEVARFSSDGTFTLAGVTKPWMFRLHHSSCSDKRDSIFKATRLFDAEGVEAHRWKMYKNLQDVWAAYREWGKIPHKEAPEGILTPNGAVWHFSEDGYWGLSGSHRFPDAQPHEELYQELQKHERLRAHSFRWLGAANALLQRVFWRHLPPAKTVLPGSKVKFTINGRDYWMQVAMEQEYGNLWSEWTPLQWDTDTLYIDLDKSS